jgi:hypothetical protein
MSVVKALFDGAFFFECVLESGMSIDETAFFV